MAKQPQTSNLKGTSMQLDRSVMPSSGHIALTAGMVRACNSPNVTEAFDLRSCPHLWLARHFHHYRAPKEIALQHAHENIDKIAGFQRVTTNF
jgi:hypothetical protein